MDEKVKDKDAGQAKDKENNLEEGLEETFPASDAPAETQPGNGSERKDEDK